MYKLCKTEQSARRQRELELGLLKAMQTKDYDEISISELCDQMQIPRKSFYRYFSNKDGALLALLDHTLMEFEQISVLASGSGATNDLERFFLFWYERREFIDALIRSRLAGMLVERATYHAIRERLMPRHLLNADPYIQQLAMTFSVCGLLSMVMQWHRDGYPDEPARMAKIATAMLSKPLIPGWDS